MLIESGGAERVLIVPEDFGSHRHRESAARVDMFFQVSVGVSNYQGYACFKKSIRRIMTLKDRKYLRC